MLGDKSTAWGHLSAPLCTPHPGGTRTGLWDSPFLLGWVVVQVSIWLQNLNVDLICTRLDFFISKTRPLMTPRSDQKDYKGCWVFERWGSTFDRPHLKAVRSEENCFSSLPHSKAPSAPCQALGGATGNSRLPWPGGCGSQVGSPLMIFPEGAMPEKFTVHVSPQWPLMKS